MPGPITQKQTTLSSIVSLSALSTLINTFLATINVDDLVSTSLNVTFDSTDYHYTAQIVYNEQAGHVAPVNPSVSLLCEPVDHATLATFNTNVNTVLAAIVPSNVVKLDYYATNDQAMVFVQTFYCLIYYKQEN